MVFGWLELALHTLFNTTVCTWVLQCALTRNRNARNYIRRPCELPGQLASGIVGSGTGTWRIGRIAGNVICACRRMKGQVRAFTGQGGGRMFSVRTFSVASQRGLAHPLQPFPLAQTHSHPCRDPRRHRPASVTARASEGRQAACNGEWTAVLGVGGGKS